MNALNFAALARRCVNDPGAVAEFNPPALAAYFGVPQSTFQRPDADGPYVALATGAPADAAQRLLHGCLFWPAAQRGRRAVARRVVRGLPQLLPTSDYTTDPDAAAQDLLLAQAAFEGEAVAEPKLYGRAVRVYAQSGELYCATDVSHDGGNPVVGAGVENARALGVDYGSQAARLLGQRYPKIDRLTRLGYVAVFVLQLPEFAPDATIDFADLVLVDVIDPDLQFVDRLEKERVAEDYGLRVVELAARLTVAAPEPMPLLRRCRALEHQPAGNGAAGYVVKGRPDESSDQIAVRVEPSSERDRPRDLSAADLAAVTEEITGQIGDTVWSDAPRAEALMLDYLGTRHRSARWQVRAYLAAWQQARSLAGLG